MALTEDDLTDRATMSLCEMYLENHFLIGQWQYLESRLAMITEGLTRQQMDVRLTIEFNKITNDLEIIKKASTFVNASILSHLEMKFGEGKKIQYLKTLDNQKESNLKIS